MFEFHETCTQGLSSMTYHMTQIPGHKVEVKGHFRSLDLDYIFHNLI